MAVEILDNLFDALKYYFNALSKFGYKKNTDVNKLLIFDFIQEILTGEMRYYITEEGYKNIEKALYCLYGSSCLLPYPKYLADTNLFGVELSIDRIQPRITQGTNIIRVSNGEVRFKA